MANFVALTAAQAPLPYSSVLDASLHQAIVTGRARQEFAQPNLPSVSLAAIQFLRKLSPTLQKAALSAIFKPKSKSRHAPNSINMTTAGLESSEEAPPATTVATSDVPKQFHQTPKSDSFTSGPTANDQKEKPVHRSKKINRKQYSSRQKSVLQDYNRPRVFHGNLRVDESWNDDGDQYMESENVAPYDEVHRMGASVNGEEDAGIVLLVGIFNLLAIVIYAAQRHITNTPSLPPGMLDWQIQKVLDELVLRVHSSKTAAVLLARALPMHATANKNFEGRANGFSLTSGTSVELLNKAKEVLIEVAADPAVSSATRLPLGMYRPLYSMCDTVLADVQEFLEKGGDLYSLDNETENRSLSIGSSANPPTWLKIVHSASQLNGIQWDGVLRTLTLLGRSSAQASSEAIARALMSALTSPAGTGRSSENFNIQAVLRGLSTDLNSTESEALLNFVNSNAISNSTEEFYEESNPTAESGRSMRKLGYVEDASGLLKAERQLSGHWAHRWFSLVTRLAPVALDATTLYARAHSEPACLRTLLCSINFSWKRVGPLQAALSPLLSVLTGWALEDRVPHPLGESLEAIRAGWLGRDCGSLYSECSMSSDASDLARHALTYFSKLEFAVKKDSGVEASSSGSDHSSKPEALSAASVSRSDYGPFNGVQPDQDLYNDIQEHDKSDDRRTGSNDLYLQVNNNNLGFESSYEKYRKEVYGLTDQRTFLHRTSEEPEWSAVRTRSSSRSEYVSEGDKSTDEEHFEDKNARGATRSENVSEGGKSTDEEHFENKNARGATRSEYVSEGGKSTDEERIEEKKKVVDYGKYLFDIPQYTNNLLNIPNYGQDDDYDGNSKRWDSAAIASDSYDHHTDGHRFSNSPLRRKPAHYVQHNRDTVYLPPHTIQQISTLPETHANTQSFEHHPKLANDLDDYFAEGQKDHYQRENANYLPNSGQFNDTSLDYSLGDFNAHRERQKLSPDDELQDRHYQRQMLLQGNNDRVRYRLQHHSQRRENTSRNSGERRAQPKREHHYQPSEPLHQKDEDTFANHEEMPSKAALYDSPSNERNFYERHRVVTGMALQDAQFGVPASPTALRRTQVIDEVPSDLPTSYYKIETARNITKDVPHRTSDEQRASTSDSYKIGRIPESIKPQVMRFTEMPTNRHRYEEHNSVSIEALEPFLSEHHDQSFLATRKPEQQVSFLAPKRSAFKSNVHRPLRRIKQTLPRVRAFKDLPIFVKKPSTVTLHSLGKSSPRRQTNSKMPSATLDKQPVTRQVDRLTVKDYRLESSNTDGNLENRNGLDELENKSFADAAEKKVRPKYRYGLRRGLPAVTVNQGGDVTPQTPSIVRPRYKQSRRIWKSKKHRTPHKIPIRLETQNQRIITNFAFKKPPEIIVGRDKFVSAKVTSQKPETTPTPLVHFGPGDAVTDEIRNMLLYEYIRDQKLEVTEAGSHKPSAEDL